MSQPTLRYAVISTDEELRDRAKDTIEALSPGADLVADVPVPFASLAEQGVKEMNSRNPQLLVVDLEPDAPAAIEVLRSLSELEPRRVFVLAGPASEPRLLLDAMRAGASEYMPQPVSEEELRETLSRALRRVAPLEDRERHRASEIIAFFGGKGGTGVTTTAVNAAVWLRSLTRKPTLLLDMDMDMGSAALLLGMRPRYSLVDVVRNFHRMDEGLLSTYVTRHDSGLDLLAPPSRLDLTAGLERREIESVLDFLRRFYAHVVVDMPRRFSPASAAVFANADRLFLVTTPEVPALRNLKRFLAALGPLTGGRRDHVRVILNRRDPERDTISLEDVREVLGLEVSWSLANDVEAVLHSTNVGKPIVLDGASRYSKDVKAFCAELAGADAGAPGGPVRGVLGRVLRRFRRAAPAPPPEPTETETTVKR